MKAISLFSCIGVAEFYLKEIGVDVVVASDIDKKRCGIYSYFYPETKLVCGDIRETKTKNQILENVKNQKIDLIISTPPCQGLSSVGKNKSDSSLMNKNDNRNSLILETFTFIDKLSPSYILFENVSRILKAMINYNGDSLSVIEILHRKYGDKYQIEYDVLNAADFGVPQNRERCYIRMYKKGKVWKTPIKEQDVITLREAIGHLPSIESCENSGIKNHWARKHPANQIEWLRNTPTGCSAIKNIKFYPKKANGDRIKAYANTYKRMAWDSPASTVTMRNEIMSSHDKVHPGRLLSNGKWSDARVLTLRELLIVMSLPPDLDLPNNISETAIRQYIGEGIPPLMVKKLINVIDK